ncbi:MAG: T9SS type A sorting domain-containing protein [Balneola sp.]
MKTFTALIFFISLLCSVPGNSQEITLQRLRGFEDQNSVTQLYYERLETQNYECPTTNSKFNGFSSHIYSLNSTTLQGSLRITASKHHLHPNNCELVDSETLRDFLTSSYNSTLRRITAYRSRVEQVWFINSKTFGVNYDFNLLRLIPHPFTNEAYLIEYSTFHGLSTKELYFESNQYPEGESYDTFVESRDLSFRHLENSSLRKDSLSFLIKSDTLYRTNDLNQSSEISLENVTSFINPANDSLVITGWSHLNIYHTNNSDLIYWFVDLKDSQNDSVQTYLLKNSAKGDIDNWEVSPVFSDIENASLNTHYYSVSSDSVLFASVGTKLLRSVDAGSNFESILTFDHRITGLYAKPDSAIIYVLTEKALFKVENGQPTSIKQVPVSNEETPEIPNAVSLKQNYPNPFNPTTTIEFELDRSTFTKITVYDVLGRKVRELVNEIRPAGINAIQFDATNLASGVYLYRLEANGIVQTKRLTLIK